MTAFVPTVLTPLIYVIDDDQDDCLFVKMALSHHYQHCVVRTFQDGSSLLTHLTHQLDVRLPDLLVLDLDMPILTGFELLTFLKKNSEYKTIPIVVVTGLEQKEAMERCLALGAAAYLPKKIVYHKPSATVDCLKPYWSSLGSQPLSAQFLDVQDLPSN
ncbi:response regulator receiver protein [Fibrisoma limi BUZ 3]|uniref:Response regulator receiver protein n=1 Tax=Fibrisoma limi BUZ 3 TaxID=1185876 RepID=I2GI02_9BACT|nr:response regulator [Fibrisoma limi]CCH53527.1 response regulator receiver protein [Fibrisoma limi BUZ 3]